MKRCVYVAGKLNAMAVDYIKNLHKMFKMADAIRREGFAVYVPGLDILLGILTGNFEYDDYFLNSQPWLAKADYMYVLPNSESSSGTQREIALAKEKRIPVFYTVTDMKEYDRAREDIAKEKII